MPGGIYKNDIFIFVIREYCTILLAMRCAYLVFGCVNGPLKGSIALKLDLRLGTILTILFRGNQNLGHQKNKISTIAK